jgi:hypothetical protein
VRPVFGMQKTLKGCAIDLRKYGNIEAGHEAKEMEGII